MDERISILFKNVSTLNAIKRHKKDSRRGSQYIEDFKENRFFFSQIKPQANQIKEGEVAQVSSPLARSIKFFSSKISPNQSNPQMQTLPPDENSDSKSPQHGEESQTSPQKLNISQLDKDAKSSAIYFIISNTILSDTTFLKQFRSFEKLTYLSLTNTGLLKVPKPLHKLPKSLKYLDFSYNNMTSISKKIKWTNLRGLNLSHNAFTRWPEFINPTTIPEIEYFNFSHNSLKSIYRDDQAFHQLISLEMSHCDLCFFPAFVLSSKALKWLDLSWNPLISDIDFAKIAQMESLRYLNISGIEKVYPSNTKITNIPLVIAYDTPKSAFSDFINSHIIV